MTLRQGSSIALVLACIAGCSGHDGPVRGRASPAVVSAPISVEGWEYGGQSGKLIRTPSYRLFTTSPDSALVDQMPRFLEAALERYTTAIAPLPRPTLRLDTFLMGDREQWSSLTRQVMGPDAGAYLRIQRGGFSAGGRALLWTIGRRDTLAIAAHEGWHQYTQRSFREPLPTWLEEAIAVYMEGFVEDPADGPIFMGWANVERFEQLRRAAGRGELAPLDKLLAASPQDLLADSTERTLTYYAQLWALLHFLREVEGEGVRRSLGAAVSDAQTGRMTGMVRARIPVQGTPDGVEVFRAYFGGDLAAADARFRVFVGRVVAGGHPETIARGESPLETP